jgi:predicted transcriptional regulator of viral defense system
MKIENFFSTHPVFRQADFVHYLQEEGNQNLNSARQYLRYHHKQGHLIHIRRLMYAVKSPFLNKAKQIDPYLIASKANVDAVLAYHTALELHGTAYTTFATLTYLTENVQKPFTFQQQTYQSVSFPKALLAKKQQLFGIEKINHEGMTINITCPERTWVDILDRPHLGGGWEEIWRSWEQTTQLDFQKLVNYTLLLENATVTAKVGFFLERRANYLSVPPQYINQLLSHIPKKPHYMDRSQQHSAKYIKKWELMVPLYLIEQQWEEPNA